MAYEKDIQVIVMLNNPTEKKKNPYWPNRVQKMRSYQDVIKVVLLCEKFDPNIYCYVREFMLIINNKYYPDDLTGLNGFEFDDEYIKSYSFDFEGKHDVDLTEKEQALKACCKKVIHIQYDDWEDMSVPDDKDVFFQFMNMTLKQFQETKPNGPMLVHCFGGVGRTGAFLVIHATIGNMMKLGGKPINVHNILAIMRTERSSLVQTPVSINGIQYFKTNELYLGTI